MGRHRVYISLFLLYLSTSRQVGAASTALQTKDDVESRFNAVADSKALENKLEFNFVEMVRAAPLAVNLVARLNLFASYADDFRLINKPDSPFNHLTPDASFKMALETLSSEVYDAFKSAHLTVIEMNTRMEAIPYNVNQITRVLEIGDYESTAAIVPVYTESILEGLEECKKRNLETQKRFLDITGISAEIYKGSLSTEEWAAKEKTRAELNRASSLEKQTRLEQQQTRMEMAAQEANKMVHTWKTRFEQDMDAIPESGWSLFKPFLNQWIDIGMRVVRTAVQAVKPIIMPIIMAKAAVVAPAIGAIDQALTATGQQSLTSVITGPAVDNLVDKGLRTVENTLRTAVGGPSRPRTPAPPTQDEDCTVEEESNFNLCAVDEDGSRMGIGEKMSVENIEFKTEDYVAISMLPGIYQAFDKIGQELEKSAADKERLDTLVVSFEGFMNMALAPFKDAKVNRLISQPISFLVKEAMGLIERIKTELPHTPAAIDDVNPLESILATLSKLKSTAQCLDSMAHEILNFPLITASLPNSPVADVQYAEDHQQAYKNLEISSKKLERYEAKYDEYTQINHQMRMRMAKLKGDIAKLDMSVDANKKIIKVLKVSLLILVEMEEQWNRMAALFLRMEQTVKLSAKRFSSLAVSTVSPDEKSLTAHSLYNEMASLNGDVSYILEIVKYYNMLSTNFLMPVIDSSAAYLFVESGTEQAAMQTQIDTLFTQGNEFLDDVSIESKAKFMEQLKTAKQSISREARAIEAEIPVPLRKIIKEEVTKGMALGMAYEMKLQTTLEIKMYKKPTK